MINGVFTSPDSAAGHILTAQVVQMQLLCMFKSHQVDTEELPELESGIVTCKPGR